MGRRRHAQRRQEAEELAAVRKGCEDLRQQYVGLWEECQRRRKELSQEQRGLAARLLSVEKLRADFLGDGPDAGRIEKRLERLEQRFLARMADAEREVEEARGGLSVEIARLEKLAGQVQKQQDDLAARHAEAARRADAWEKSREDAEAAEERRRLDFQMLCARHDQDMQLIARLRDELERTVRLLMDEPGDAAPTAQAA